MRVNSHSTGHPSLTPSRRRRGIDDGGGGDVRSDQVGLSVEERFSPARLDEHVGRVRLLDRVDLADLEEHHVHEHRHLHRQTDRCVGPPTEG